MFRTPELAMVPKGELERLRAIERDYLALIGDTGALAKVREMLNWAECDLAVRLKAGAVPDGYRTRVERAREAVRAVEGLQLRADARAAHLRKVLFDTLTRWEAALVDPTGERWPDDLADPAWVREAGELERSMYCAVAAAAVAGALAVLNTTPD